MTWRPRYSWRTLLIVTTAVGIAVGLCVRKEWRREVAEDFAMAVHARDVHAAREYLETDPGLAKRVLSDKGQTPLHIAAFRLEPGMLKLLLDSGVDVNVRDRDGVTALQLAANAGWVAGARLLLDKGADVNAVDGLGMTALHWSRNVELCELLLQRGADLEVEDKNGCTPLADALRHGRTELVHLFRKHGAKEASQ